MTLLFNKLILSVVIIGFVFGIVGYFAQSSILPSQVEAAGSCGSCGGGNPPSREHEHEDLVPSCVISASPTSLIKGNTTTLKWSTTRTNTASINQGVGYVLTGTDKTMVVSPATNTTYTMTVTSVDNITRTCATTVTVTNPIPAPTCVLSATPTSITAGQTAKLTWTSTNAINIGTINQGVGDVNPQNTNAYRNVSPTHNTVYTMIVKNRAGVSANCATTVTVTNPIPAPTCILTATPNHITAGQTAKLTWTTHNAIVAGINQGIGVVALNNTTGRAVTPQHNTVYTMIVKNRAGVSANCATTVTVTNPIPAPTCILQSGISSLDAGNSTVLTWTSTNATTRVINQGIGSVAVSGSRSINPSVTTTYTMTVTNISGVQRTCTTTVIVIPQPLAPRCDDFTASPSTINRGQNSTLTWHTTNASSVTINNAIGRVDVDGTQIVAPLMTTIYTLTAFGTGNKSVTCPVTVTVIEPNPVISCANNVNFSASPSSIRRGDNTTLTWTTTGVTSLSIDNGISLTTLNGSASISPSSDTTYTMTATNGHNTISCPVTVDVSTSGGGGGGSATPRCTLSASDNNISAGSQVTLKWNTSNATGIFLNDNFSKTLITTDGKSTNDKKALYDDEITVRPEKTTTYTLKATRGSRERKCEVTVNVKDNVVLLQTRDQLPLVSGISLTQVPYTGFEAGPFLTLSFYTLLVLWALYLAYVLVIRRNSLGAKPLATAGIESADEKIEQNISNLFMDTTMNKPIFHQPTVVAKTAPVAQIGYESMVVTSDETNEIENRAHAAHVLFSSDAMRYFVATTEDMDRMKVLDAVLERTKASYPAEDGWVVLNEDRIKTQCEACRSEGSVKSNKSPFIPVALPIGNSSLAEVIVAGNIVTAYQMIGNRPMIALADAAADLDALYRIKQGEEATISNMLASSGENVSAEQLHLAISAITSALDGTYTNEAEAVKMAIMKATKAING